MNATHLKYEFLHCNQGNECHVFRKINQNLSCRKIICAVILSDG